MKLIIGNKNYSSWSLRPWLLMTQLRIPFEERVLSFNDPAFKSQVAKYHSPGKVPILLDGDLAVWDTLAIVEYLAEKSPEHGIWPKPAAARARARSICAEMHSSFGALRSQLPMNCELQLNWTPLDRAALSDIARVFWIWEHCRTQFGQAGPFLFGEFSAADAFFAPVVRRFLGFSIVMPELCAKYARTIDTLPAMRKWVDAGLQEHEFVAMDEPYRDQPG
jgi:glutathione S-transferase